MGFKVERLQELIRLKVATILQRDLADPRMGLLTVTRVKLAKDLSQCEVLWSILGDESARTRCEHMLADATGFIQREVAGIMKTRVTPELRFAFDPSIERSARIAELLRKELGTTEPAPPTSDEEPAGEPEAPDNDADRDRS